MPGRTLLELHRLWLERERRDEFMGTLINAWLRAGGAAWGVCAGESYVDVGTLHGYREAMRLLGGQDTPVAAGVSDIAGKLERSTA